MKLRLLGVVLFVVVIVLAFVYVGQVLTRVSGQAAGPVTAVAGINPEAGETIFWGKGKCHTCHSVGGRGSAIRAPNLGETGPTGQAIATRAELRAKEREKQGKAGMGATDYLVESLAEPGAYVVEGYKNEMPLVYQPPTALKPDEIKAVITYLQTLGGQADAGAIKLPAAVTAARALARAEKWKPYLQGDLKAGEALFFDQESPAGCAKCHKVKERGSEVGPELTNLAGTRPPSFIIEAILEPDKEIASGFESVLIVTKDGRYLTGIVKKQDEKEVVFSDKEGKLQKIARSEIEQLAPQKTSLMPGNFKEILTMESFHDLLAYLMTLQ